MSELPPGWEWTTIGDLLVPLEDGRTIHQGWSPKCETHSAPDDSWGVLKTTAIQPGSFQPEHNKALPSTLDPRPGIEVRTGDLLLTCAGPRARCGVACLVRSTRPRLMLSGKMYRFRVNEAHVSSGYLDAYLQSARAWIDIDAMKTGGSDSGLNLTQARFRALPVPLAPRAEQEQIVVAIEEYLSRLDASQRILTGAEVGVTRLELAALSESLVHRDADLIGLADLCSDTLIGLVRSRTEQGVEEGTPYVRMQDLATDGRVMVEEMTQVDVTPEELSRYELREGDLLFNTRNSAELVGKTAIVRADVAGAVFNNNIMRIRLDGRMLPDFALMQFISPQFRKRLSAVTNATTSVAAIYAKNLLPLELVVPPLEAQVTAVRRFHELREQASRTADAIDHARARARSLRTAILAAAFSGQLISQDPSDEPATALLERIRAEQAAANRTKHTRKAKAT